MKEEYEPDDFPTTPIELSPNSPLRALRRMRLGLSPLFFIESNLLRILAPECKDSRDMAVRAGDGWKALLRSKCNPFPNPPGSPKSDTTSTRRRSQAVIGNENDPTSILVSQRDDIISLWKNPETQEILNRRRPHFRDQPGLWVCWSWYTGISIDACCLCCSFMDDLARIARTDYAPTDRMFFNSIRLISFLKKYLDDIIRARIRTMGIEEYRFGMENSNGLSCDFYIIDVGGTRNQVTNLLSARLPPVLLPCSASASVHHGHPTLTMVSVDRDGKLT